MRAKKSYGQHFLTNEQYAQRIAASLSRPDAYKSVLEVGPGKGMLTKYLLQLPHQLKVVEADPEMVAYLEHHYPELSPEIIGANFLRIRVEEYLDGPFALIGNFPYNISSQILIKMIDNHLRIPEMVGMFQREVADRIVAGPGSKTYGVIGVFVQVYYEVEMLFGVSKGNFNPPPKVQSAVIRCVRRERPLVQASESRLFRKVVKAAFGQRRKMLRNSIKQLVPEANLMEDPFYQNRPEQLTLQDFVELTRRVQTLRTTS